MEATSDLAIKAVETVRAAAGRSLRIRGFLKDEDGYHRTIDGLRQLVRIGAAPDSALRRAAIEVDLETSGGPHPLGPLALHLSPLWDLIPGRERGCSWTVTPDSRIDVVAADIVEALERFGIPYLDLVAAGSLHDFGPLRLSTPLDLLATVGQGGCARRRSGTWRGIRKTSW